MKRLHNLLKMREQHLGGSSYSIIFSNEAEATKKVNDKIQDGKFSLSSLFRDFYGIFVCVDTDLCLMSIIKISY